MQVLNIEFILLWCTYLAIMFTNLEAGIGIGFVLATMYFAFSYARVSRKGSSDLYESPVRKLRPACTCLLHVPSREYKVKQ